MDLIYPFNTDEFKMYWEAYKQYRKEQHKFQFKSKISEQMALKRWFKNMTEDEAINTIEHSIANGWRGIFPERTSPSINKAGGGQQAFEILKARHGVS